MSPIDALDITGAEPFDRMCSALRERLGRTPRLRPGIYWLDLIASAGIGWILFFASGREDLQGIAYVGTTCGATIALLRALVFLHEISHDRAPPLFEPVWNLTVGMPMCVPSIMYLRSHLEHHRVDRFATGSDPEYAPIARWSRLRRILFVASGGIVPALLVIRWGVLGPLSLLSGRLRSAVLERCSTLSINPRYVRRRDTRPENPRWGVLEFASATFVWCVACATMWGVIPIAWVTQWFVVVGGVFVVNQVRTLVAHGYANEGSEVDLDGQFFDSINLRPNPLAALVAPLGLRYHALHHLLPGLPYHSLGRVHRELSRRLPPESPYWQAERRGLAQLLRLLASSPGSARSHPSASPIGWIR